MEQLADADWKCRRVAGKMHKSVRDKSLCTDEGFEQRPSYFRCLLVLRYLLAAGLPGLMPGQVEAYYKAALLSPSKSLMVRGRPYRQLQALPANRPLDVVVPPALVRDSSDGEQELPIEDDDFHEFQVALISLPGRLPCQNRCRGRRRRSRS